MTQDTGRPDSVTVIHLTTVDLSLRFLVMPQLLAVVEAGGRAIGLSAPGPWVAELEAAGIKHVSLKSSTRDVNVVADLKAVLELWRILRRLRPDVLHTHNPKPGIYGRIIGRLAGVPVVVNTVHGLYATEDDPRLKRAAVYLLEAVASRFSDQELVQSREDLRLMVRLRISPGHRARLLGNGVDLDRFDPDRVGSDARHSLRKELDIRDDQIVVGTVGRLVAEKGYRELFEAMTNLDERYVLVVVGPSDPEKGDNLTAAEIDAARQAGVRFLGMRDDVDRIYPAFDVFVLASHREGFPRAAMEAASMGIPVVATDIRGCREVVEHGVNGLLVAVRDPDALAAAIHELGGSLERRAAMADASRAKAVAEFDERRIVDTVIDSYRVVADRKGLGPLLAALPPPTAGPVLVRPARQEDAGSIALLHIGAINRGFLPQLGWRFLTMLYQSMIGWEGASVVVATAGVQVVGFGAGVVDTGIFYRRFAKTRGLSALLGASGRLVRPRIFKKAWETARYSGEEDEVRAEVLSIAVDHDHRGQGIASKTLAHVLHELRAKQVTKAKTVVGLPNPGSIGTFEKAGFKTSKTIEVHRGEISQVLIWEG